MIFQLQHFASALKSGRSALGWSQPKLAEKSGISLPTIVRLEQSSNFRMSTALALLSTFKENGVVFVWKEDGFEMTTKYITQYLTNP